MSEDQGNWLALLKWSLAQGVKGDGTGPSTAATAMTEEDRRFLDNAMKDIVNEPERLREIMSELVSSLGTSSATRDEKTSLLLDELLFIIEQVTKHIHHTAATYLISSDGRCRSTWPRCS